MFLALSLILINYSDEDVQKTTLVEGSVKVNDVVLKPGEQYSNGKKI